MAKSKGRPPLPEGEARKAQLLIQLTPAERALLDAAAQGGPVSAWARGVLLREAARELKRKGKP